MRAALIGLAFAALAFVFWDDEPFRRLHVVLANVWLAASYIAFRLERRA